MRILIISTMLVLGLVGQSWCDTLGGYGTSPTSAPVSGVGSSGRDFIDKTNTLSAGTVSGFSVTIAQLSVSTSNVKLKVWRQSGSNLVLVGQSEVFTNTITGVNTFSLATPFTVLAGDYPGVWINQVDQQVDVNSVGGSTVKYAGGDNSGTVAESGFSALASYALNVSVTGTLASGNSISITGPADGAVYQRSGTSGPVTITGNYTGTPTSIQARVVQDGTSTEVVTWTTIVASPSGGAYSGTITAPQGGWYNVQTRFSNDTSTSASSTHQVGVGVLVAFIGQSNAAHFFTEGTGTPDTHVVVNTSNGWVKGPTGYGAANFGNMLHTEFSVPIGLLNYGVGSTRLLSGGSGEPNWLDLTAGKPYPVFKVTLLRYRWAKLSTQYGCRVSRTGPMMAM